VPRRSPLLPIFLIVLVDVFGLAMIIPLLTIYAEQFGATALQATLLISIYAACQLFSGPLLGKMSDRIGRKPLLVVSQLGTFIGFIIMARASSLWMLYAARVIDGSTAGNISLAQAYISDNSDPKDRTKSFALIGIAFGLGFLIGPLLTAYLVKYGLSTPIYAASAMSLASIVCTLTLLPNATEASRSGESGPARSSLALFEWNTYAQYLGRPVLNGLLAQFFFYTVGFSTFTSGFALFAERRFKWHGHPFTPREIGFVLVYVGALGIILQGGFVGRLAKRFGESALVSAGFASLVVAYVILGPTSTIAWLAVVSTISSFGNGVLRPALTSLVTQNAGRHEQGVALGVSQSLNSVALIVAPIVGGTLIGRNLLTLWAWIAAGASLVGLVAARWGSSLVTHSTAETSGTPGVG
jgi:MFS family permease